LLFEGAPKAQRTFGLGLSGEQLFPKTISFGLPEKQFPQKVGSQKTGVLGNFP